MRKIIVSVFLGVVVLMCDVVPVSAAENNYAISTENQDLISAAIAREESNKDYLDGVIRIFNELESEESFNKSLNESLIELSKYDEEQSALLDNYMKEVSSEVQNNELQVLPENRITTRTITPANPAYATALSAYKAGILLVQRRGHWQTANYMNHAIASLYNVTWNPSWRPPTYYNRNDTWANIVDGEELVTAYYSRLKAEAFRGGRTSGSFTGSYTFNSGHLLTALRGVSYTVSYRKQANGNYWTQTKVTDIFDFKWEQNGYDGNFGVGFGNNYAYAMQRAGYIRPFKIEIVKEISR
ncbi:hypothetical protein PSG86_03580 [Enterococcus faecalis]|nr:MULTISPECIES: hypothetical protein [Enterococcus]MDV7841025.1 hypothetical protein [Enterococcus faecalis]MDV7855620.1 hypothetical protein [Enterococcus faecalis]MEB4772547.1 hypothetical protein [Enterococcus sp. E5-103]